MIIYMTVCGYFTCYEGLDIETKVTYRVDTEHRSFDQLTLQEVIAKSRAAFLEDLKGAPIKEVREMTQDEIDEYRKNQESPSWPDGEDEEAGDEA